MQQAGCTSNNKELVLNFQTLEYFPQIIVSGQNTQI